MSLVEGTKHDGEKPRWDLVDYEALAGMVAVLTFGATKYEDRNWEKGIKFGRVFGACMRHLTEWWVSKMLGKDGIDPETGLSALDHAACCIHFLSSYEKRKMVDFDDRPYKD